MTRGAAASGGESAPPVPAAPLVVREVVEEHDRRRIGPAAQRAQPFRLHAQPAAPTIVQALRQQRERAYSALQLGTISRPGAGITFDESAVGRTRPKLTRPAC